MRNVCALRKANFWLRVTALTVDEVILVTLTYLLMICLKYVIPAHLWHSWWFIALFYETLDYNYYTLFWYFGGQTPGKRLLRTKLIKADGSQFTYRDAFIRYWIWMLGVALLGIGYFWIAWDREKRGWNDMAAKTYVVRV